MNESRKPGRLWNFRIRSVQIIEGCLLQFRIQTANNSHMAPGVGDTPKTHLFLRLKLQVQGALRYVNYITLPRGVWVLLTEIKAAS